MALPCLPLRWLLLGLVAACASPASTLPASADPSAPGASAAAGRASVDEADDSGMTALHRAAQANDLAAIEALRRAGANLEARTQNGDTPLLVALGYRRPEAARALIEAGAAVDGADMPTPLLAVAARDGELDLVRLILQRGARVNGRSQQGYTALHAAAGQGHAAVLGELLRAGASVDLAADDRFTPLHTAASDGKLEATRVLLDAGASLEARTRGGETPLFWAIFANRPQEKHIYERLGRPHSTRFIPHTDAPLVALLLARGASLKATDDEGNTPLHHAVLMGAAPSIKLLLQRGASRQATNSNGKTPLALAQERHDSPRDDESIALLTGP